MKKPRPLAGALGSVRGWLALVALILLVALVLLPALVLPALARLLILLARLVLLAALLTAALTRLLVLLAALVRILRAHDVSLCCAPDANSGGLATFPRHDAGDEFIFQCLLTSRASTRVSAGGTRRRQTRSARRSRASCTGAS